MEDVTVKEVCELLKNDPQYWIEQSSGGAWVVYTPFGTGTFTGATRLTDALTFLGHSVSVARRSK